jgi:uncharacterized coiled-coil DUF342 family protein
MSFENSALLIVVVGGIALLAAATNVVQIISAFRRKPPAEAQFADALQNRVDHETIHRRISSLRDEVGAAFVPRPECAQRHESAQQFRDELLRQMLLMNKKLDEFLELRGELHAKLDHHEKQIAILFRRNGGGPTA